jgi:hypothetical protein
MGYVSPPVPLRPSAWRIKALLLAKIDWIIFSFFDLWEITDWLPPKQNTWHPSRKPSFFNEGFLFVSLSQPPCFPRKGSWCHKMSFCSVFLTQFKIKRKRIFKQSERKVILTWATKQFIENRQWYFIKNRGKNWKIQKLEKYFPNHFFCTFFKQNANLIDVRTVFGKNIPFCLTLSTRFVDNWLNF